MSTLRTLAQGLVSLLPPRLQTMAHWRFIKFGLVGASGTVINIAVLYLAQEHFLRGIASFHSRLNYSIAVAITLATLSNFYWNRRLTWRDRTGSLAPSAMGLFLKYVMAAALSIAIQSLLTKWLALHLHYLLANVLAIVMASAVNFLANDRLTFRRHGAKAQSSRTALPSGFAPPHIHEKP
jgi:dolichol-phosphate mannosyltransferase